MSLAKKIPGMRSGAIVRNVVIGILYILALPFVLTFLLLALTSPLTFVLAISIIGLMIGPFVAAVLIGTNFRDIANRFENLPGISPTGGVVSGALAFVYVGLLFGVLVGTSAGLGATGTDAPIEEAEAAETDTTVDDNSGAESDNETAADELYTVSVTVVDGDSDPVEDVDVVLIDDALIFKTQETEVTDSTGAVAFTVEGGDYDITVTHEGYESTEMAVSIADSDEELLVTLTAEAEPEPEQSGIEEDESKVIEEETSTQDSTQGADTNEEASQNAKEVVEVPAYEIVETDDISYAGVDRIQYRITTDQHPDDISDEELLLLAEEIVAETTQEQPVNAVVIHIWDDESDVGWTGNDAKVEWAPNGDWASAGDVRTGDYSIHEYAIERPGL